MGYEAIEVRRGERVWLITPASRMRLYVEAAGRIKGIVVTLHLGGQAFPVDLTTRKRPNARIIDLSVGLESAAGAGALVLRVGSEQAVWPIRLTAGHATSLAATHGAGALAEALAATPSEQRDVEEMWAAFFDARAARGVAQWSTAIAAYARAAGRAEAIGVPTWAARFLRAAAHTAAHDAGDVAAAARFLEQAALLALDEDVDGAILDDYQRGMLAAAEGDASRGAGLVSGALDRAARWGAPGDILDGLCAGLSTLPGLHRHMAAPTPASMSQITEVGAIAIINLSWNVLIDSFQTGDREPLRAIDGWLQRVIDELPAGRHLNLRVRALANLAWSASLLGDVHVAHQHVDAAYAVLAALTAVPGPVDAEQGGGAVGAVSDPIFNELLLLDGRLWLQRGQPTRAGERFTALCERATARIGGATAYDVAFALHGLGQVHRDAGRFEQATRDFGAALTQLDRLVGHLAIDQRGLFFRDREPRFDPIALVDDAADHAQAQGDLDHAFHLRDAACARGRAQLWHDPRGAHLSPDGGEEWAQLDSVLALLRQQAHEASRLRGVTEEARRIELERLGRAIRHNYEDRLRVLRADAEARPAAWAPTNLSGLLKPEEALLLGWGRADGCTESWWLTADALRCDSGELTAAELEQRLNGIAHLYVISGPLSDAWSRLPELMLSDGRPLAACVGLSFLPSVDLLLAPWPAATQGAAVVADTRGDLLHARRDGDWCAQELNAGLLAGDDATHDAVCAALRGASLLHFSGHGMPALGTDDGAELALAQGQMLRADDVVQLEQGPVRVVLNGCNTGGTFASHALSLPAALLVAGAMQVLVTIEPVPDAKASDFIRDFYQHGGATQPAKALTEATAAAFAAGESIWRSYRLIGRR